MLKLPAINLKAISKIALAKVAMIIAAKQLGTGLNAAETKFYNNKVTQMVMLFLVGFAVSGSMGLAAIAVVAWYSIKTFYSVGGPAAVATAATAATEAVTEAATDAAAAATEA